MKMICLEPTIGIVERYMHAESGLARTGKKKGCTCESLVRMGCCIRQDSLFPASGG